jgi:SAM-dependent methyltransferase
MQNLSHCFICGSKSFRELFQKSSPAGFSFTLKKCRSCSLEFLDPLPDEDDIAKYYGQEYFSKRTDRGYDDYFSSQLRREIERVIKLNLGDIGFFKYEKKLGPVKRSLDIGCAAGYFVNYLKERQWDSYGIDISAECVNFAKNTLKLNVERENYLKAQFNAKFDLITLWATIEHLHHPDLIIEKALHDLKPGGCLYISTCRTGFNFKIFQRAKWRYYNFPEHIFYFSSTNMTRLLEEKGFTVKKIFTYGSGFGNAGTMLRTCADFIARQFFMGDMMVIAAQKELQEIRESECIQPDPLKSYALQ